jgi:hypothetical protein
MRALWAGGDQPHLVKKIDARDPAARSHGPSKRKNPPARTGGLHLSGMNRMSLRRPQRVLQLLQAKCVGRIHHGLHLRNLLRVAQA